MILKFKYISNRNNLLSYSKGSHPPRLQSGRYAEVSPLKNKLKYAITSFSSLSA
jgi:hypothetical protein